MTASINFNSEPYFGQKKIEYSKYSYINSNYSAAIFDRLAIDTSASSFTITLPNTNLVSSSFSDMINIDVSF